MNRTRRSPAAVAARYAAIVGQKFGMLTVMETFRTPNYGKSRQMARVRCDCGVEKEVMVQHIENGDAVSCGCKNEKYLHSSRITHGRTRTGLNEYGIWIGIIRRCNKPGTENFANYGGRGIKVCPQWCGKFGIEQFLKDVGPRPSLNHSIDRIDNDGDYEPGNVRWATATQQVNNRRPIDPSRLLGQAKLNADSVRQIRSLFASGGISKTELANRFGVSPAAVSMLLAGKTWSHVTSSESSETSNV